MTQAHDAFKNNASKPNAAWHFRQIRSLFSLVFVDSSWQSLYLHSSLSGPASEILWDIQTDASDADVISLLKTRFSSFSPSETDSRLYLQVQKLLSLAYPGETGQIVESLARDSFLGSLRDPGLKTRILDQRV